MCNDRLNESTCFSCLGSPLGNVNFPVLFIQWVKQSVTAPRFYILIKSELQVYFKEKTTWGRVILYVLNWSSAKFTEEWRWLVHIADSGSFQIVEEALAASHYFSELQPNSKKSPDDLFILCCFRSFHMVEEALAVTFTISLSFSQIYSRGSIFCWSASDPKGYFADPWEEKNKVLYEKCLK